MRPDFQGLPVVQDRLVQPAARGQGDADVVVRQGVVRLESQCLPEVREGLVQPALPDQGGAQVAVGLGVGGLDFDCLAVVRHGLVRPPEIGQGDAQVVLRQGVLRGAIERAAKERFAVAPERRSTPCAGHQNCYRERRNAAAQPDLAGCVQRTVGRPVAVRFTHPTGSPRYGNTNSNLRQVRKAVGHRLACHLNQSDCRHQHPRDDSRPTKTYGHRRDPYTVATVTAVNRPKQARTFHV